MPPGVEVAGVARVVPAVVHDFARLRLVLVIAEKERRVVGRTDHELADLARDAMDRAEAGRLLAEAPEPR